MERTAQLNKRYKALSIAILLVILSLISVLIYNDYKHFVSIEKEKILKNINRQKTYIDSLLKTTTSFVKQRKLFIENSLENTEVNPDDLKSLKYPSHQIIKSATRDDRISLFMTSKNKDQMTLKEIGMVQHHLEDLHISYATTGYYIWSYYTSKDGTLLLYPNLSEKVTNELFPNMTFDEMVDVSIYQRPHWKESVPSANPDGEPFWTKAYIDDGGTGLIITHGTPIYVNDKFQGMFAVDISLSFLSKSLNQIIGYENSKVIISNYHNQVIAGKYLLSDKNEIQLLEDKLSGSLMTKFSSLLPGSQKNIFLSDQKSTLFCTSLTNAPFDIIATVSNAEIFDKFIERYSTNLFIIFLLMAGLFTIILFVSLKFIKPMNTIVNYVYNDSAGTADLKQLPIEWQSWMDMIVKYPAMRSITENLPGAVFRMQIIDNKVKLLYANDKINILFNIDKEHSSITLEDIFSCFTDSKDIDNFNKAIAISNISEAHFNFECKINNSSGYRWVMFLATKNTNFDSTFFDGIILDIDSLKAAERKLDKLNEHLQVMVAEELQKRKISDERMNSQARLISMGEMIGAIAHQWRQPLNSLGIIVQDIEDASMYNELTNEYVKDAVAKALSQIMYMSHTIDDFRDYFKAESEMVEFDIAQTIYDTLGLLSAQLTANDITISLNIDGHIVSDSWNESAQNRIPSTIIYRGFPNELKQVIMNLIKNASEAIYCKRDKTGAEYTGTIQISLTDQSKMIEISVADNGCGIPLENQDKIFDPYFTTKGDFKGTGIGLYMSKNIIEDHMKGRINFVDEKDETRFIITLPKASKE